MKLSLFAMGLACCCTFQLNAAVGRCSGFIPPGGAYDIVRNWSTLDLRMAMEEHIYMKDYRTHDEAIADGFQEGGEVFGVKLEHGRSFSKAEKDTWKREFEKKQRRQFSKDEKKSFESLTLNVNAMREVTRCLSRTNNRGLNTDLVDTDDCNATFAAWYTPNSFGDLPPLMSEPLRVTGGVCETPPKTFFLKAVPYGGWKVNCRRNERESLKVVLNTSKGSNDDDYIPALPDPGPQPSRTVTGTIFVSTREDGQPLVTKCDVQRKDVPASGSSYCDAPGPIIRAEYDCGGEGCGWFYPIGATLPNDGYDHNCHTCGIEGNRLTWRRYFQSSAPATMTYTIWYKLPKEGPVTNTDYDQQLQEWERRNRRTCGPARLPGK